MEYLKKLRIEKGISQQVVADYLEITRQAYSNYENGNRSPDNETLLKLGEFFGVSVDTLLRGQENASTSQREHDIQDEDLKAAFFGGYSDDLSPEEIDALWQDAKDFMHFKAEQLKRKGGKGH